MRGALVLAALATLAGCAGTQESTACGYATAHFTGAPEAARLREAFERAGHAWDEGEDGTATVRTSADRTVIVSAAPGTSGSDLVLSAEAATVLDAATAVSGLAGIVNETAPQAELTRFVAEERACEDGGGGGKPGALGGATL